MTARSTANQVQRGMYLAQRTLRDVLVLTGKNGPQRYVKRVGRRVVERTFLRGLR